MRHEDLPERWKTKLQEYLKARGSTESDRLGASDFPLNRIVRIQFEDGSHVEFRHAFVIEAPELREVAVFTEHCGYHLFPLYEELDLSVSN
ncbi:hypothetical protein [Hymenobacter cellulosilyticus]|uniref:Uncharacterized protein n=1 Tax=Hymenobacter cellulosilyticus TaxID=2932248 RepID=A0A8T9QAY8_9BACT|nr:hypothetical protein [Hymenobacter cellulosilyticus]UOQ74172.1 hypothetical protein MUN79_09945 [Hymenobacter cellulosilyticus]